MKMKKRKAKERGIMAKEFLQEAMDMQEELAGWRRDLHQIPELDLTLPKTVEYVTGVLKQLDIPYELIADGSSVVAYIGKKQGGKCFLLRSDMDGLPIQELTELEFASQNGNMHACGHDMHATILLGAAKLLKKCEEELNGTVKLLFQAGEETFRGAKAVVECGVLKEPKVDAAFAMHVSSTVPVGVIGYGSNPMASVYGFQITLTGHGGHGSSPEVCIDPINAGVQVYMALQSLIARECPPSAEAVLTIGQFTAGNAANIIPEKAILQGTLRTFQKEVTEQMIKRINEIVPAVATAYRTEAELTVLSNVPSVVCDKELNEEIKESIKELNSELQVLPLFHVMGSEDFAFISDEVTSSYFAIGAGIDDESKRVGQHNPQVQFNEKCLPIGAAVYAKAAIDWLEKHSL